LNESFPWLHLRMIVTYYIFTTVLSLLRLLVFRIPTCGVFSRKARPDAGSSFPSWHIERQIGADNEPIRPGCSVLDYRNPRSYSPIKLLYPLPPPEPEIRPALIWRRDTSLILDFLVSVQIVNTSLSKQLKNSVRQRNLHDCSIAPKALMFQEQ
jgi:hypothetical protein